MKKCTVCKEEKPLSDFHKRTKSKDGLAPLCKLCTNAYHRKWDHKNRDKVYAKHRARRARIKAYIDECKSVPCTDCNGIFDPVCMDFDHIGTKDKVDHVSNLFNENRGLEMIKAEIAKCEVVCSNCHRLRTKRRLEEQRDASF